MSDYIEKTKRVIKERLEFVDLITNLNKQFLDPKKIRETPEGGWTHPWMYFDSLRVYLLLTCFDILGQPAPFKDFQTWLSGRPTEAKRTQVLDSIETSDSLLDSIKSIHRHYLNIYGVKKSFYRFINDVLSDDIKQELLYSIKIRRIGIKQNKEIETIEDEEMKKKFLYTIRNSYTHKAINTGSPGGGVFPNHGQWVLINGIPKKGWEPIYYEIKNGDRIEYGVRDWPNALIASVTNGLISFSSKTNEGRGR